MVSGGSPASTSCTLVATTVRMHDAVPGRLAVGVRVAIVVPEPPRVNATGVASQVSPKESRATVTGSLNVTVTAPVAGTSVAPSAGELLTTNGAVSTTKEKTRSAAGWSGGSTASTSETLVLSTVAVHASPSVRAEVGVKV